MKMFFALVMTLIAIGNASAQFSYEPPPRGAIPADTLPYGINPDTLSISLTKLQAGEHVTMPQTWNFSRQYNQSLPSEDKWWRTFDDTILDKLIEQAESSNFNIAVAMRRMQIAHRAEQEAKAAYFPTIGLQAGYNLERASGATTSVLSGNPDLRYLSLGLTASWEIDLFGRVREQEKSARAGKMLAKADYDAAMVSLCAQLAKSYVQLRLYQAQRLVAREHVRSQERIVEMTRARHEAGLAAKLDVVQSQVVLTSTQATVPPIDAMIDNQIGTIATLLGTYPDSIAPLLKEPRPMPNCFQVPATGTPLDLLRRRPDIAQVEANLAADAAKLGIAKKDFLPTLTIQGQVGVSAHNPGDMFKNQALTYSVAPSLNWTVFDGMARNYRLAAAREQMEADIDTYNETVMTAVQEVSSAANSYEGYIRSLSFLDRLVSQSREALDLSVSLYRSTLTSFTNVVDAQQNLLEYENSRLQTQANALIALVSLYESLGGGY